MSQLVKTASRPPRPRDEPGLRRNDKRIDLSNPNHLLHVLRNPWGWNHEVVRQAALKAADEIERLQKQAAP